MKIYEEKQLRYFDFWSGAKDTANCLTYEQLDEIESILEDVYPDGIDATTINDIFWFEQDTIAEWLGYDSWDDFVNE